MYALQSLNAWQFCTKPKSLYSINSTHTFGQNVGQTKNSNENFASISQQFRFAFQHWLHLGRPSIYIQLRRYIYWPFSSRCKGANVSHILGSIKKPSAVHYIYIDTRTSSVIRYICICKTFGSTLLRQTHHTLHTFMYYTSLRRADTFNILCVCWNSQCISCVAV